MISKEVLILIGREQGSLVTELSLIAGLDTSNVSRRHDAAIRKMKEDPNLNHAVSQVIAEYHKFANTKSPISQA